MGVKRRQQRKQRESRLAGQSVKPSDLSALVKKAQADQEKIRDSRTLTAEGKHAEMVDSRNAFRQSYIKTRQAVEDSYTAAIEAARRKANAPASPETTAAMAQKAAYLIPRWTRNPASMTRDAEQAELAGDEATLRLIMEQSDLVPGEPHQKTEFLASVKQVLVEDHMPEDAVKGEKEARALERDLNDWQVSERLRANDGLVKALGTPPPPAPNPQSGSQYAPSQPQR